MIVMWYHPRFGIIRRHISADFEAVRFAYIVRGAVTIGRYSYIAR